MSAFNRDDSVDAGKRHNATARVTVEVLVEVGSWGMDCQIGQLVKQAEESAVNIVMQALSTEESKRLGLKFVRNSASVTGLYSSEK